MNRMRTVLIACLAALLTSTANAAELGDKAAPLKIKTWVKGKPVSLKKGKGNTIFVIEFWATWCPPCRQSIPHLTEMQEKYKDKDVIFVGVSDEEVGTVRPFVKDMGDKMNYVVAVDDDRATSDGYMKAYNQGGIPCAFIVDMEGKVAWVGHPMNDMESHLDEVIKNSKKVASKPATPKSKVKQASTKMRHYFELVKEEEKPKSMSKLAKSIIKLGGSDAKLMEKFARTILTDKEIKHRDEKSALKAAKLAYDATKGRDALIVETYAMALYETGDKEGAVREQKLAVKLCKDSKLKSRLKKTLKKYEDAAKDA